MVANSVARWADSLVDLTGVMKVAVMDERLAVRWDHLMVVLMAATMAVRKDVQ